MDAKFSEILYETKSREITTVEKKDTTTAAKRHISLSTTTTNTLVVWSNYSYHRWNQIIPLMHLLLFLMLLSIVVISIFYVDFLSSQRRPNDFLWMDCSLSSVFYVSSNMNDFRPLAYR